MGWATGTIDSATTVGNQAYTGIGGKPKALILFGGDLTAVNSDTSPISIYFGASDGTNDGCLCGATSGPPTHGQYSTTEIIDMEDSLGTKIMAANVASFDADGFTLNYSTAPATARKINYIAIWGTNLTNVYCDRYTFGTGSSDARTAAGFTPDFLFVIARKATRAGFSVGVSKGTGAGDEWGMGFRWRDSVATRYTSYDVQDRLAVMADSYATPEMEFSLASFDANGWTINKDAGGTSDADFIVLALKGGNYDVGYWDSPATAIDEAVTGLSNQPEGYFLASVDATGATTGSGDSIPTGYGASDGTNETALWHDVSGKTYEDHGISNTKVIQLRTTGALLIEDADHKSLDSGGFTVTYTTVEAAANIVPWWAFSDSEAGGGVTVAAFTPSFINIVRSRSI